MLESAEHFAAHDMYQRIEPSLESSTVDHYADSILLSIAYEWDENDPLLSTIGSSFYRSAVLEPNQAFLESMENDYAGNAEYIRYWHGSAAFMRVMHLFWNVEQIYRFHGLLLLVLFLILCICLARQRFYVEAFGLTLSMILVGAWYVPSTLEYTWTFLVMLVISLIGSLAALHGRDQFQALFLISGMITVYLDFLTAETLTLLIPLLLILRIREREGAFSDHTPGGPWRLILSCCVFWLIGYCGMWAMKWLLASVILGVNVQEFVTNHIAARIYGSDAIDLSLPAFLREALSRNIGCLLPFDAGAVKPLLAAMLLVFAGELLIFRRYHRYQAPVPVSRILPLAALGLVPYIRFLILHNHSYLHYIFTFRAQAASILALFLIFAELAAIRQEKKVRVDCAAPQDTI